MIEPGDTISIGYIQKEWNPKWSGKIGTVTKICQLDPPSYFVIINNEQIMLFHDEIMKVAGTS